VRPRCAPSRPLPLTRRPVAPPIVYAFHCAATAKALYLGSIGVASAATLAVCVHPSFAGVKYRAYRAATFSALGLLGLVPIGHQVLHWTLLSEEGRMPPPLAAALQLEILMGALYLTGAWLFARRVPERYYPGRFNLMLSSHNLFHLLVVAAACVCVNAARAGTHPHASLLRHTEASLILLAWRDGTRCD